MASPPANRASGRTGAAGVRSAAAVVGECSAPASRLRAAPINARRGAIACAQREVQELTRQIVELETWKLRVGMLREQRQNLIDWLLRQRQSKPDAQTVKRAKGRSR